MADAITNSDKLTNHPWHTAYGKTWHFRYRPIKAKWYQLHIYLSATNITGLTVTESLRRRFCWQLPKGGGGRGLIFKNIKYTSHNSLHLCIASLEQIVLGPWWRHHMEIFPPYRPFVRGIAGEFPSQRPMRDAELWGSIWSAPEQKKLSKQSRSIIHFFDMSINL